MDLRKDWCQSHGIKWHENIFSTKVGYYNKKNKREQNSSFFNDFNFFCQNKMFEEFL